jgi:tetratricopeptide (TPR) repeat protein
VVVSAVAGMAGVGKTALALVAIHRLSPDWFAGGVFFVDFHGYTPGRGEQATAEAAAGQLLRLLGVPGDDLPAIAEELLALYRSVLDEHARAGNGVLVVADNVAEAAQVEPLVSAHACHRLLVTSRHTLSLPARQVDLDAMDQAEAIELLQSALRVWRAGDGRVASDPDAAAELVRLCGRLPLAVRIIAAVLAAEPGLPLAALAAELAEAGQRLNVLQTPGHSSARPSAVRASFDLSYRRLTRDHPGQARLFRLLSAAPGPDVSTEAAAVLDGRPAAEVRRDLRALAAAHLVTGAGERWSMHDLMRLYADEQAAPKAGDDSQQDALDRLYEHYRQHVRAANARLAALPGQDVPDRFTDRADALAWLDAERANLITTTITAAQHARHLSLVIDVAADLGRYLDWRRYFDDWLATAEAALAAARELGDRRGEGVALSNLGIALRRVLRFEESITAHQQAATLYRKLRDRHGKAFSLNNLGIALRQVLRFEESITAHQQAATLYRKLGDRHGEGQALGNLGNSLQEVRRFEEAITAHQQDVLICQELGDQRGEGQALNNLGLALRHVLRFEEAITAHQQAITIYQELGDRHGEGIALNNLGVALLEVQRFEEAITAHQQAITIYQELGDRHGEGQTLGDLGIALLEVQRFEEAITAHQQAITILEELGDAEAAVLLQPFLEEGIWQQDTR